MTDVDLEYCITDFSAPSCADRLAQAEVLLTSWGVPPVEPALDLLPRLRAVVHAAGSVKGHLTPAVWARGVAVASSAGANAIPVAEFTVAAVLFAGKSVTTAVEQFRAANRRPSTPSVGGTGVVTELPEIGNYGRTVGIIGASRVGRLVISRLRHHDLDLLLHDPFVNADEARRLGVRLTDLSDLMTLSTVVSVHAPLVPSTLGLLDATMLALLPDGATLINTARGAIIDPDALERELVSGRLNAYLDVTLPEPLPSASPLWSLPNVALTPHLAGSAGNELLRIGDHAVDEIVRWTTGRPFVEPVLVGDLPRLA
ncbi:MAG: hydroxyacid dehydrogenase [Terracoccus sp.]